MPKSVLGKNTIAYKNKLEYIKQYNKKMPKIYVQFNPKTEGDMLEWLDGRQKATYIKQLIREDMKKNKGC